MQVVPGYVKIWKMALVAVWPRRLKNKHVLIVPKILPNIIANV